MHRRFPPISSEVVSLSTWRIKCHVNTRLKYRESSRISLWFDPQFITAHGGVTCLLFCGPAWSIKCHSTSLISGCLMNDVAGRCRETCRVDVEVRWKSNSLYVQSRLARKTHSENSCIETVKLFDLLFTYPSAHHESNNKTMDCWGHVCHLSNQTFVQLQCEICCISSVCLWSLKCIFRADNVSLASETSKTFCV